MASALDRSISDLLSTKPPERAWAWLIGRQVLGVISATLFGQFTKEVDPPPSAWTYMGRNVESTPNVGNDYELKFGHIFPDETMLAAKLDTLTITDDSLYNDSLAAQTVDADDRVTHIYVVAGCTLSVVNGRYYPCGIEAGSIKYRLKTFMSFSFPYFIILPLTVLQYDHCSTGIVNDSDNYD
jgi:hypothetical protein